MQPYRTDSLFFMFDEKPSLKFVEKASYEGARMDQFILSYKTGVETIKTRFMTVSSK